MARSLRVLILEDVRADAELVIHELRRAGFAPEWQMAAGEADYLAALTTDTPPQIIFADFRLPGFDAMAALHLLQQRGLDVPFVVVTGYIEEDALECMKAGATDYLLKDRLARLGQVVESALEQRAQRAARRQAEAALQATAERLAGIVASAMDAIVSFDCAESITLFNRAAEQSFQFMAAEALGQPIDRFLPAWTGERERLPFDAGPAGHVAPRAMQARRSDGQEFPVEASISYANDASGGTTTLILRDVTEMRRARERVEESERLRALGEMASGIAHDFNNMLAIILGRCELLLGLMSGLDVAPRLAQHLEVVRQAARDGEETVKRLQTFSGISRRPSIGAMEVGVVLRDVLEFTRPRWRDRAQQTGVTIDVSVDDEPLPPLVGNPSELREVLVNMVFNAVDALPHGGAITLRARQVGDTVQVQVADTGTGMTDEVRRRVFDPFFSTKGTRGAGLGLSMSYGIVARLGGRIEVDSAPGRGTAFTIIFPFRRAEQAEPVPEPVAGGPLRILLVDDEPQILTTTRLMLEVDGHTVTPAGGGAEALALLAAGPRCYDVVLTDLGMPGMNGMQLLAAMRAAGYESACVLVTGWGIELAGDDMEAAGAQAVLPKPFSAPQLREALAAISRRPASPGSSPGPQY